MIENAAPLTVDVATISPLLPRYKDCSGVQAHDTLVIEPKVTVSPETSKTPKTLSTCAISNDEAKTVLAETFKATTLYTTPLLLLNSTFNDSVAPPPVFASANADCAMLSAELAVENALFAIERARLSVPAAPPVLACANADFAMLSSVFAGVSYSLAG